MNQRAIPGPPQPRGACRYGHTHAEAFMLMTYRSDDGSVEEQIWNSRDGVTPFVITSRDGTQSMTHVDWGFDVYQPDRVPAPGERIFVDLTPERAAEAGARNADRFWDEYPDARQRFRDKDEMARKLAKGYLEQAGTPDLIEVT